VKQTVNQGVISHIRKTAQKMFTAASGSHDWEHTLRVYDLCRRIGAVEQADMEVLLVAAYLHDIGRCYQDRSNGAICHAEKGYQLAEPIVQALPLHSSQKTNILHCIRSHRFRGNHTPETREAQVLFDADKLDAIGAVGVARAFLFAGEVGARLHNPDVRAEESQPYSENDTGYREFRLKLRKIKNRLITGEGKRMAEERHRFMEEFFQRFLEEYEGKR
jgi:uncharacterized protein